MKPLKGAAMATSVCFVCCACCAQQSDKQAVSDLSLTSRIVLVISVADSGVILSYTL